MHFKDHKLVGVLFDPARWIGGEIIPEIVVLHDTASRLEEGSAADFLKDNEAKVSVQFIVEIDGSIIQQVPVNRRANHAGKSHYHGRKHCNGFSVGIEIVNVGRMTKNGADALTWFGQAFDIQEHGIQEINTPEHGAGLWMPYPEVQLIAVQRLLTALFSDVETLKDIVSHWYISPGRKVDTNPLFPLDHIRARVLGRDDPADDAADAQSDPVDRGDNFARINVPGDSLNMRRWPSLNPNIIGSVPHGTIVPVERLGVFDGRIWLQIFYGGQEGWVVQSYTIPIASTWEKPK